MYRKRNPHLAAFSDEKDVECAPFSTGWQVWREIGKNMWLMARRSKGGFVFAPLYVHSFRFLRPHKLTEAEKFNIQYPDPSMITNVADKLRYYRYKKSLRQRDVADYAGINKSTYIHYENPEHDCYPIDKLSRIAELLEVDITDLLDEYNRFLYEGQGQQIRAIRKGMGLTQNEFGRCMGVHGGTVKKWEGDQTILSRASWEIVKQLFLIWVENSYTLGV
ncbi:helix-turn-helix domain-containing protein [Candidatus Soleaferrea massiliensis]|uniref:helix-turn-helix domain-containing protein n=1 Tax=Candidatus Soleaferrea massiliensis TaxID=1470354 RepID=UPI00058D7F92|nr:helix-turn-helix domain-containing protein [Candidatus Soleaferrea massiliensis]